MGRGSILLTKCASDCSRERANSALGGQLADTGGQEAQKAPFHCDALHTFTRVQPGDTPS